MHSTQPAGHQHPAIERHQTPWGPVTPWIRDPADPARRMTYYLGTGSPGLLSVSPVPLFLAATRLVRYRRRGERFAFRVNHAPYAGDSGAYSALMLTANPDGHPWFYHPDRYGSLWTARIEDIGAMPDLVGIQDFPCEPSCLARTGGTIRDHQLATRDNYLYLSENFPHVPWLRTLQGWHPEHYLQHHQDYLDAGVEMTGQRVGIGSICRDNRAQEVARVIRTLAPLDMRMHGFGLSIPILKLIGAELYSADSHAWSKSATYGIRLPGCTHLSRRDRTTGLRTPTDCRNCFRWAVHWRERALDAVRYSAAHPWVDTAQPGLFETLPLRKHPAPRRIRRRASRARVETNEQLELFGPHAPTPH